MKQFTRVIKAFSDPNRVKIVKLLQHKSMCVCELTAILDIAQPTVSKHLRILEDAGIVNYKKEGLWMNYYLEDGSSSPYAATLLGNLRHWLEDDPEICKAVKKITTTHRKEICGR